MDWFIDIYLTFRFPHMHLLNKPLDLPMTPTMDPFSSMLYV